MKPWSLGPPPPSFRQEAVLCSEALRGSTDKPSELGARGSLLGACGASRPQGAKHVFICSCSTKCLRGYKATKVIFLKRENGSSRCGLEEAVVTGQPRWEGPSRTWGDNQGAEGAPPGAVLKEGRFGGAAGGTPRAPAPCSPANSRHPVNVS